MKEIPNKLPRQFRTLSVVRETVEGDENRFAFALSSEEPADQWFGREVLQHDAKSIRQDRLKAGIPLLFNHDRDQHMGVVDGYEIKGGKLRVQGKWSSSDFAQQKKRDYDDGILKDSSVGYLIHKITREQAGEYPSSDDTLNVTDWEPMEASLVTIPADPTVGVGRSVGEQEIPVAVEVHRRDSTATATETPAPAAATPVIEVRTMAEPITQPDAHKQELDRRDAIQALAADKDFSKHVSASQVRDAIAKGISVAEFSEGISRAIIAANQVGQVGTAGTNVVSELGKDQKRYSLLRAQRLALHEHKASLYAGEDFSLEREVSDEIKKRAGMTGSHNIFMPTQSVRVNTATATSSGQTAIGGTVTATTTIPDVIPMFRIQPKVMLLGARHLGGINGNLKLPRQTGSGTAYWLAETVDTPESDITLDFLTLSPKRLGIQNQYTVELLAQDAVGIENLLSSDRDKTIAIAVDSAALLPGSNGTPNGLLGQTGLALVTSSGAALVNGNAMSYNDFLLLEEKVADANADVGTFSFLATPGVRRVAKTTPMLPGAITGPIWNPLARNATGLEDGPLGYQAAVTNQVPKNFGANSNLHACIFGDFSNILVGDWGASELIVDPYTKAGQAIYVITERLLMDVQVRQVAPFAVCETAAVS